MKNSINTAVLIPVAVLLGILGLGTLFVSYSLHDDPVAFLQALTVNIGTEVLAGLLLALLVTWFLDKASVWLAKYVEDVIAHQLEGLELKTRPPTLGTPELYEIPADDDDGD